MKQLKIERLTEKDIIIPYEKIIKIEGGRHTRSFMITYMVDGRSMKIWFQYETTMAWYRMGDDGTEHKAVLIYDNDFDDLLDFIKSIIRQNEEVKAIDSL